MAREAMDVCLRVLKKRNKRRFDSYSVRNSVLIISHITFRDCRVNIFSDNLSRNTELYTTTARGSDEGWLYSPTYSQPSPFTPCQIGSTEVSVKFSLKK